MIRIKIRRIVNQNTIEFVLKKFVKKQMILSHFCVVRGITTVAERNGTFKILAGFHTKNITQCKTACKKKGNLFKK